MALEPFGTPYFDVFSIVVIPNVSQCRFEDIVKREFPLLPTFDDIESIDDFDAPAVLGRVEDTHASQPVRQGTQVNRRSGIELLCQGDVTLLGFALFVQERLRNLRFGDVAVDAEKMEKQRTPGGIDTGGIDDGFVCLVGEAEGVAVGRDDRPPDGTIVKCRRLVWKVAIGIDGTPDGSEEYGYQEDQKGIEDQKFGASALKSDTVFSHFSSVFRREFSVFPDILVESIFNLTIIIPN